MMSFHLHPRYFFRIIVRRSAESGEPLHESAKKYFADFNLYTHMAHFVGKLLHIRPNDILDTWGVAELIVAYGEYANEIADENFQSWKSVNMPKKGPSEPPKRYAVRFIGPRELEDGR